jgi:hypothetical protein
VDANDTDSWRVAVKLIEYGWGRPAEQVEVRLEIQVEDEVEAMSLDELQRLQQQLLDRYPGLRAVD